ncbi:MAG: hypothetical protein JWM11_3596, partial [Planctomycetaceae bacterium]|nr:hypothetical protein [Planctomycetaceae bacterium]
PSGLDQEMKDRLAHMIGLASVGFSRVLERAFEEAAVTPPDVAVSLHAFLATMKMPLNWVMRKITDAHERAVVEAIYLEVQEKGKAIDSLPEDEKVIRKLHAQEVLRVPMRQLDAEPARPTGTQYGTGKPARGLTAKHAGGASIERSVVSASQRVDSTRETLPGLEACLMVPLAANNPIDHVADTALRALLSQSLTPPVPSAMSPEGQASTKWLNRGSLPAAVQESEANFISPTGTRANSDAVFLPAMTSPSTTSVGTSVSKQAINQPLSVSKSTAAEMPTPRKKAKLPAASYPEISPPAPIMETSTASLEYVPPTAELDASMFAPLPPMPRARNRDSREQQLLEKSSVQTVPTPATVQAKSAPAIAARPQQSVTPPNSPPQRPQQTGFQTRPQGATRPVTNTPSNSSSSRNTESRPIETRSQEERFASQKSYSAEPPASPIPVPHIRTDDLTDDLDAFDRPTQASSMQSATGQPSPRIVVSTAQSTSQSGPQHVNRLLNVTPAKSQPGPQNPRESTSTRPAALSFDFQTASGPLTSQSPQGATSNAFRMAAPNSAGRVEAVQSSLFSALNSPTASQPSAATKPAVATPQPQIPETPAPARPNMFQRPISPPVAPAPAKQIQPTPRPVATQHVASVAPQPVVQERTAPASDSQTAANAVPVIDQPLAEAKTPNQTPPSSTLQQPGPAPVVTAPVATDATPTAPREPRYFLELQSPLQDAPSIGPKTAELFASVGVRTVFDLFRINTDQAAEKLGKPQITAAVLKDWQAQALLVCRVPRLRGHDAQYLVCCGVRTAEQLANCDPQALLTHVQAFIGTPLGQRLLRNGKVPDLEEVNGWIDAARNARSLRNE